jgi:hypothetical protein
MGNMAVIATEIDQLVVEIRDHMIVLVEHRAQVGAKLAQLRAAVESTGEAWWPWLDANEHRFLVRGRQRGKIGRREIERLLKIGRASNPQAALEDEREKAREGMLNSRATNVSRDEDEPQPDDEDHQIVTVQGDFDDLDDGADDKVDAVVPENYATATAKASLKQFLAEYTALDDARNYYARELAEFGNDQMALIQESVKLDKARKAAIRKKRASTLSQDGRSAVPVDDPAPENGADIGDIPPELDRRRH